MKGRINDQQAVTECIVEALREAEAAAGVPVGSVIAGIGGMAVRGHNARGALELGYSREVTQSDVNRVLKHASHVQMQEDRMLLQLFPQDFVVDGHPGYRDPRKMMAAKLEVNVHLITASVQEHTALVGAINQAHLAGGGNGFRGAGGVLRGGAAGGAAAGHRAGGYRRAFHRNGGVLRRCHVPGLHRAHLRRPFHGATWRRPCG